MTVWVFVGVFMIGFAGGVFLAAWKQGERRPPHVSPYCRVCGRKVEVSAWPVRADPETGRVERYMVRTECPTFHAEGEGISWLRVSPEDLERVREELAGEGIVVTGG